MIADRWIVLLTCLGVLYCISCTTDNLESVRRTLFIGMFVVLIVCALMNIYAEESEGLSE